jgi:ferredoxin
LELFEEVQMAEDRIKITVKRGDKVLEKLIVDAGRNLRDILVQSDLSPYQGNFRNLNCRGMGICGTCKVYVLENSELFERRSCQIQCFQDLEIRLK